MKIVGYARSVPLRLRASSFGWQGYPGAIMDDRNLVAVAEQAAATSRVVRGPIAGCTVRSTDGRVFRGCLIEFEDPSLDLDPISGGLAVGRVEGMRTVDRIGYYSPTGGKLPTIPASTLLRLREIGTSDLAIIFSPGSGEQVEKSLLQLLAEADLA
jgi:hypothetical protein